ncbi:ER-derived vesicles protein [Yarrowia sp. C11]|nr:ER-derived vesicles protein [Yarrowia sp. E02]KAG5371636.1 ER-derived vesicles protein [Yarrowia sp. C11]
MLSKLFRYDAFAKPTADATIKTASGGIVTLLAVLLILVLTVSEYRSYTTPVMRSQMTVDRYRGDRLDIHLNITFPKLPCSLVTLDIIDSSGEVQQSVDHDMTKVTLDERGRVLSSEALTLGETPDSKAVAKRTFLDDPNYCGSCYGAESEPDQCCNTCEQVRAAYATKGWAFTDGSGVEQCEVIGFKEQLKAQYNQGCNIAGKFTVQKVAGNFHFAPGVSMHRDEQHSHDLSHFKDPEAPFTFSHIIHDLSFGEKVDVSGLDWDKGVAMETSPLENTPHHTDNKWFRFNYFTKVVSTRFEFLNGKKIETNQYAATAHERPLQGGRDEDHQNTRHMRGGLPGVFFSYDISPMRIVNKQEYRSHFGAFVMQVVATIGGVLTVAAVLDRGIYEVDQVLKRKKDQ